MSLYNRLSDRLSGIDPIYYYIFPAAFFTFLGIAFGPFGSYLFEGAMIIPCVLFLKARLSRSMSSGTKVVLGMSLAMFAWFLFLMVLRCFLFFETYPLSPYFCAYFFAFPLACLMQDGEKKQGLKLFSMVYVAASVSLSLFSLLMTLDFIPAYFTQYHIYWDAARLNAFWHPNMGACLLMFGVGASISFLLDAKSLRAKLIWVAIIAMLVVTIAVTNCRTIVILTGGLICGTIFFSIVKGRWKMIIPAGILACAIIVLVFIGSNRLYTFNESVLVEKYTALYQQQILEQDTEELPDNVVISEDGTIALEGTSGQNSFANDITHFNGRIGLWEAALTALKAHPLYPIIGVDDPGRHMSYFSSFEQTHTHNSWVETLLGLGIPGLLISMVFTLFTLWNCLVILLKHADDTWKRVTALMALCMMVASFMEPYLFLPPVHYYIFNFVFLLHIGYLAHWQEEDNKKALQAVRKFLHIGS